MDGRLFVFGLFEGWGRFFLFFFLAFLFFFWGELKFVSSGRISYYYLFFLASFFFFFFFFHFISWSIVVFLSLFFLDLYLYIYFFNSRKVGGGRILIRNPIRAALFIFFL